MGVGVRGRQSGGLALDLAILANMLLHLSSVGVCLPSTARAEPSVVTGRHPKPLIACVCVWGGVLARTHTEPLLKDCVPGSCALFRTLNITYYLFPHNKVSS